MADVRAFPRAPRRCWTVRRMPDGSWRGELREHGRAVTRTEDGPLYLVQDAMQRHCPGLPILDSGVQTGGWAA